MTAPVERPLAGAPDAPPLFLPDEPFPPYRFVPGKAPHPFMHAGGYAYQQLPPPPPYRATDAWRDNAAFLRGCDFFNRGWWWEAHEVWEGSWHVCKPCDAPQADLLQSLIQYAAAALNRERGHDKAAQRLLGLANARLAVLATATPRLCGLDLAALMAEAERHLGRPRERVDGFYLLPG